MFQSVESWKKQLTDAIMEGSLAKVKKIFSDENNNDKLLGPLKHGNNTALHLAALHGKVAIVKFLLEQNANCEAVNDLGKTPLMLAVAPLHTSRCNPSKESRTEIFKKLWPETQARDHKDNEGFNALHYAEENGFKEISTFITKTNSQPQETTAKSSLTLT